MKEKVRKGISAIIFIERGGKREYLILKRKKNWKGWECLKGGRRRKESEFHALKREIKEEIGVSKFKAKKTRFFHEFKYEKEYMKDNKEWDAAKNKVYLVQVFSDRIKIDRNEHSGFKWMAKQTAMNQLTWPDYEKIFKKLA